MRYNPLPELCRFGGISFHIYQDHLPPHIHAKYSGIDMTIDIRGCRIRSSERMPPRVMRDIREWVTLNEVELLKAWDVLWSGGKPSKIPPLR